MAAKCSCCVRLSSGVHMRLQEAVWVVERILQDKIVDGKQLYLVKWKGFKETECTWEPEGTLGDNSVLSDYLRQTASGQLTGSLCLPTQRDTRQLARAGPREGWELCCI